MSNNFEKIAYPHQYHNSLVYNIDTTYFYNQTDKSFDIYKKTNTNLMKINGTEIVEFQTKNATVDIEIKAKMKLLVFTSSKSAILARYLTPVTLTLVGHDRYTNSTKISLSYNLMWKDIEI